MPRVEVQLPSLLAVVDQDRTCTVEADTLRGALAAIAECHPRLGLHLFDESGGLRPHVLCFHNGRNTRWLDDLEVPLDDGDRLLFMQAVSGG